MIKIENYNTFTDEVLDIVIQVDTASVQRDGDGNYFLDIVFSAYMTEARTEIVEGVPNHVQMPYDITSDVNVIKCAYNYLASLKLFNSGTRV